LFANLVSALIEFEAIRTTHAKARETRRLTERAITIVRRVGDVVAKQADSRTAEESARLVHAMRRVRQEVRNRNAVQKLFDEIGPRYLGRHGGYTRITKLGARPGDAAPISLLELMPDEAPKTAARGDKADKAGGKADKTTKSDKKSKPSEASAPSKAKAGKAAKAARSDE
jgi:large subunit ribosomal protein L17